jgi:GalNAc5-diNAcBac-PP-undecaprenol beta-1,3-glucosyltransferase
MSPRFTVLIPTFSNGALIHAPIVSVLRQSASDFELFVVLDGAPDSTREIVEGYAARDPRVRAFAFPKGERHGEAWRDVALREAQGKMVCYLSDDDFWFSDHLETMATVLHEADFGHTRHVEILPNLHARGWEGDLADVAVRQKMSTSLYNFFGLSVAGHRLESYRRLPAGWSPGPTDLPSDLHMWRKWLASDMRFRSSSAITSLHFARVFRKHLPPGDVVEEPRLWLEIFSDQAMRDSLRRLCPVNREQISMVEIVAASRRAAPLQEANG